MGQPFYIHQNMDDFDEFCCNLRSWDIDCHQLETGPFSSELLMFGDNTAIFSRAKLGRRLIQKGASPEGLITFGILADPKIHMCWRNYDISGDMLCIFPKGGELDCVSHSNFDVYPISITEELLNQACELLELPYISALTDNTEVIRCNPQKLSELRHWLQSVYHMITTDSAVTVNTHYLKQIKMGLAYRLVRLLADQHQPVRKKGLRKRDIALRMAENYISESTVDVITIPELCMVTGASERTLEYAFCERYKITPKKYTLIHRLNNVRKQLRRAEPDVGRVSEIANQHGFWHMGQFSADYKKLFGELPSKTLKVT